MNYREQLNTFWELEKQHNLNLLDIEVAEEVNACFEKVSEEEFETICSIVERAYLKGEGVSVYQVAEAVNCLLQEKSLEEVNEMSNWDILGWVQW